jgi:hypothetical protein
MMNHSNDKKDRQYSREMCGVCGGGGVQVEVHCFFKQGNVHTGSAGDAHNGEIHEVNSKGAGTEGPLEAPNTFIHVTLVGVPALIINIRVIVGEPDSKAIID